MQLKQSILKFAHLGLIILLIIAVLFSLNIQTAVAWPWDDKVKEFKVKENDINFLKEKLDIEKSFDEIITFTDEELLTVLNQKIDKEKFGDITYGAYILSVLYEIDFIDRVYTDKYRGEFSEYFNNIVDKKTSLIPFIRDLIIKGSIEALTNHFDIKFGTNIGKLSRLSLDIVDKTNKVLEIYEEINELGKMYLLDGLQEYLQRKNWGAAKDLMYYRSLNPMALWSEERWNELNLEFETIYSKWKPHLTDKGIKPEIKEQIREEYKLLLASAIKSHQESEKTPSIWQKITNTITDIYSKIKDFISQINIFRTKEITVSKSQEETTTPTEKEEPLPLPTWKETETIEQPSILDKVKDVISKLNPFNNKEASEVTEETTEEIAESLQEEKIFFQYPFNKVYPIGKQLDDGLYWDCSDNDFGTYLETWGGVEYNGFHSGEDWNLKGGNDLGEKVYAIGEGKVVKISKLIGNSGMLVAIKHEGSFIIPAKKIVSNNGETAEYHADKVDTVYSVYMHLNMDEFKVEEDQEVGENGENTILGQIMDPGGGPHLHLEIRLDDEHKGNWSADWSLVDYNRDGGYQKKNGYFINLQKMIDAGLRDPSDFIEANSNLSEIDTISPTISIYYPSDEQVFQTSNITVNGFASDNKSVSKVEIKVNYGNWQTALGTNSWSKDITLIQGSNTIIAKATDTSGNTNLTSITVSYNLPTETGNLTISSNPSGANVYVNEIYKGITPLTLNNLSSGSYTIIFSKSGYQDCSKTVQLNAGDINSVSCTLTEITPQTKTGNISVSTTPVSGKIYINGVYKGTGSYSGIHNIGTYTISFGEVIGYQTPSSLLITLTTSGENITAEYIKKETPKPDLIVDDIWVEPSEFNPNSSVKLYSRIKNVGAGDSKVVFKIKRYFDGNLISIYTKDSLNSGESFITYSTYTWLSDSNYHTIKVVVDSDNQVSESSEINNEKSEQFKAIAPTVPAKINSYSPSSKKEVNSGESFTISVTFTNTGNTGAYFYAGASVWDSNWNEIFDDWGTKTYLGVGQQKSASWTHTINTPGEYYLQFGVWDETKSQLLDKAPSPSQNLIKVRQPTTTVEKEIWITDPPPYFTKGAYVSSSPQWYPYTFQGHSYTSAYVGGTISDPNEPDYWAEFKPYLTEDGYYEVYASFFAWPYNSRKVPYTICWSEYGCFTQEVDQYSSYNTWKEVYLGLWYLKKDKKDYTLVRVTDATGEPYDGKTTYTIGSVKFVKTK